MYVKLLMNTDKTTFHVNVTVVQMCCSVSTEATLEWPFVLTNVFSFSVNSDIYWNALLSYYSVMYMHDQLMQI